MSTCTCDSGSDQPCQKHFPGECFEPVSFVSPSVDWQARALAAEGKLQGAEHAVADAVAVIDKLQPLADLALKIGEAKRYLAAAIHAPKFPGWIAAASGRKRDLAALLDQAAALGKAGG